MNKFNVTLSMIAAIVCTAGILQAAQPTSKDAQLIASAGAAAPLAIGSKATVMMIGANGKMTTLRAGSNGWTCFPDDPSTPGKDPMCVDHNGLAWMAALLAHKAPPAGKAGLSYMLQGGSDASNLDPRMTKPPAGAKWVSTGPHIMILSATAAAASGYPTRERNPDTTKPYIMYGGTPYQHIMVPVR